jgi:hypothetical protein
MMGKTHYSLARRTSRKFQTFRSTKLARGTGRKEDKTAVHRHAHAANRIHCVARHSLTHSVTGHTAAAGGQVVGVAVRASKLWIHGIHGFGRKWPSALSRRH